MDRKAIVRQVPPPMGPRPRTMPTTKRIEAARRPDPAATEPAPGEGEGPNQVITVVGIGASAGGLEALQQLFRHLPAACRPAFVVIQHFNPHYKSAMNRLLSTTTRLAIVKIEKDLEIQPGCVYLAPPDHCISLLRDRFRLAPCPKSHGVSLPIDHFFRALAAAKGRKAIGIILSGTGSDGTRGIKAIKTAGGSTFAQLPNDARYSSMPESAIASGMVDFILPAMAMGAKLNTIVGRSCTELASLPEHVPQNVDPQSDLKRLFSILQSKTGLDISIFKTNLIRPRIAKRMSVHQLDRLTDYVTVIARDPAEPFHLLKAMHLDATRFFSNPSTFEVLRDEVVVPLIRSRKNGANIRVWVAGCSTGEEAYTVSMLLAEVMHQTGIRPAVKIFASDVDADALGTARRGTYPFSIAADVPPERLERFFDRGDKAYKVKHSIRDCIVFSNHNLVKDPPFSDIDLICCRNLLACLRPELQKKLPPIFHFALRSNGYLFLGPTETIGSLGEHFLPVSARHKIFKHRDTRSAKPYRLDHLPTFADQSRDPGKTDRRAPITAAEDVNRLREALASTQAHLQTAVEALEASNEEYRATNEELQSLNEELLNANEELEITNEELQSTNEELMAVNAERQQKIEELNESCSTISNLLESTEVATLFLTLNLCVRRFTPAVTRIINLRQTDIGRPISHLSTHIQDTDIHDIAVQVLDTLERKKRVVQDKEGRWYEMLVLPYRTGNNVIDGVTIAFSDITDLHRANMLREMSAVFDNAVDAVIVQDFDGNILAWNRAAEALFGWSAEQAAHLHISEITAEKSRHDYAAATRRLQRGERVPAFEVVRIPRSGEPITVQAHASIIVDDNGRPIEFATFERPATPSTDVGCGTRRLEKPSSPTKITKAAVA